MNQKTTLAVASFITVFVLTLMGGLAVYMARMQPAPSDTYAATAQTPLSPQPDANASLETIVEAREAAYRQELEQADSRLQQANTQLQQAYTQLEKQAQVTQPTPTNTTQAEPNTPVYAVSPIEAVEIVLSVTPGVSLVRAPELVNFRGTVAYEVQLEGGSVYVDANNGRVLYNGVTVLRETTTGSNFAPATRSEAGKHADNEYEDDEHGEEGD